MLELERITARRNELDTLAEELAKQLTEVQAEREELVIAERVLHRPAEQHRAVAAAPPADYRKILAIVRAADGPVQVRAVGEELGLEVTARGKLQPLRAKMTKLADRGRLHKRPDGRYAARSRAKRGGRPTRHNWRSPDGS